MVSGEHGQGGTVRSNILEALQNSGGEWVSGEELSRKLGMSRAAVSKHMRFIREAGYPVESMTRRGYRLSGDADSLQPDAVTHGLETVLLGKGEIVHLQSTPSTNMEARVLAERGAPEGTVVLADEQTAGRGRQGRPWLSPAGGGVYMSVVLRPKCDPQAVPVLTLMAAVAVTQAVRRLAGVPAVAKWPNDILVYGCKMSGVLIEAGLVADVLDYAVAGIGINVNTDTSILPPEISGIAISLNQAAQMAEAGTVGPADSSGTSCSGSSDCMGGTCQRSALHTPDSSVKSGGVKNSGGKNGCQLAQDNVLARKQAVPTDGIAQATSNVPLSFAAPVRKYPRAQVARCILEELEAMYEMFRSGGGPAVVARWKELSGITGRHIRLGRGEAVLSGRVVDVDDDGWLLLEDEAGTVHRLPAGDILDS